MVPCDIRGCIADSGCTVWLNDPREFVSLCNRHAAITAPTQVLPAGTKWSPFDGPEGVHNGGSDAS
jgi:hypothetical protein